MAHIPNDPNGPVIDDPNGPVIDDPNAPVKDDLKAFMDLGKTSKADVKSTDMKSVNEIDVDEDEIEPFSSQKHSSRVMNPEGPDRLPNMKPEKCFMSSGFAIDERPSVIENFMEDSKRLKSDGKKNDDHDLMNLEKPLDVSDGERHDDYQSNKYEIHEVMMMMNLMTLTIMKLI